MLTGIFHANDKGFGFVAYDDELPDAYIAPDNTMMALNGDEVSMEIVRPADPRSDKGPEAKSRPLLNTTTRTSLEVSYRRKMTWGTTVKSA